MAPFLYVEKRRRFIFANGSSFLVLADGEKIESLNIKDYKIIQSERLYRFTSDSVILSRFAAPNAREVCDLCSGSGIVGLHYYALNDESVKRCALVEIQPSLAEMSKRSVMLNGLETLFEVINAPLQTVGDIGKFDLVLCNPPYDKNGSGIVPKDVGLAIAKSEVEVTLEEIIAKAYKLLKVGGRFTMCHKSSRLAEIFSLTEKYKLNVSRLAFVYGADDKAYLVLVEAVKGKKQRLEVYNAIINDFKDFSGNVR